MAMATSMQFMGMSLPVVSRVSLARGGDAGTAVSKRKGYYLHRCVSNFRDGSSGGAGLSRVSGGASGHRVECGWSSGKFVRSGVERGLIARGNRIERRRNFALQVTAEKPDFTNVAGNLLKIGKDGFEAGTKMIPESVPRPVARGAVGLAGVFVGTFLLRSLFSTAAFILVIGGLCYAGYFFFLKGDGNGSSGNGFDNNSGGKPKSTDEALDEARKIMEKYK